MTAALGFDGDLLLGDGARVVRLTAEEEAVLGRVIDASDAEAETARKLRERLP